MLFAGTPYTVSDSDFLRSPSPSHQKHSQICLYLYFDFVTCLPDLGRGPASKDVPKKKYKYGS